jgi:hypothetical protein
VIIVRKGTRAWLALRLIVLASGISSCGGETERVFLHVSSAEERQVRVYADPDDPADDVYEWRLLSPDLLSSFEVATDGHLSPVGTPRSVSRAGLTSSPSGRFLAVGFEIYQIGEDGELQKTSDFSGLALAPPSPLPTPVGYSYPSYYSARSLTYHPTEKFAYVVQSRTVDTDERGYRLCPFSSDVLTLAVDPATGAPTRLVARTGSAPIPSPFSVLPAGTHGYVGGAEGGGGHYCRNSYGGLYGYAIDGGSGALAPLQGSPFSRDSYSHSLLVGDFLVLRRLPSNLESRIDVFRPRPDGSTALVGSTQGDPLQGLLVAHMVGDPLGRFVFVSVSPYYAPHDTTRGIVVLDIGDGGNPRAVSGSAFSADRPDTRESSEPGAYSLAVDPLGRYLYSLSRSRILAWRINRETGALEPLADTPLEAHRVPTAAVCSYRR